jgi:hypothetical protein
VIVQIWDAQKQELAGRVRATSRRIAYRVAEVFTTERPQRLCRGFPLPAPPREKANARQSKAPTHRPMMPGHLWLSISTMQLHANRLWNVDCSALGRRSCEWTGEASWLFGNRFALHSLIGRPGFCFPSLVQRAMAYCKKSPPMLMAKMTMTIVSAIKTARISEFIISLRALIAY